MFPARELNLERPTKILDRRTLNERLGANDSTLTSNYFDNNPVQAQCPTPRAADDACQATRKEYKE